MEEGHSPSPKIPAYFSVPIPHHFRIRPDFLDEACVVDAYDRTLPRNQVQHAAWLRLTGKTTNELPHEKVVPPGGYAAYVATKRYLLTTAILAGERFDRNILLDARGFPVLQPNLGLFPSVIIRAIQYCVMRGIAEADAKQKFFPVPTKGPAPVRMEAEWVVGLEHATGYCTILCRGAESERAYLAGQSGYMTPFPWKR